MQKNTREIDMEKIIAAQVLLQKYFPSAVLVGGTAARMHANHRMSFDADHVVENLSENFNAILLELESLAGWETARIKPPVLILGNFMGIETGIRQLIRREPLEVEFVSDLKIPTIGEMLRIKAWLIVSRNAIRDYLDFCALYDTINNGDYSLSYLTEMDVIYKQDNGESVFQQLIKQLCEFAPYDIDKVDLSEYKNLCSPWDDIEYIWSRCQEIATEQLSLATSQAKKVVAQPWNIGI